MRTYTPLTRGKRYQIRALLKASFSQYEMVFFVKVHKSAISREIRRNRAIRVTPTRAGSREGLSASLRG